MALAFFGKEMPRYQISEIKNNEESSGKFTEVKFWKAVLVMVYVYYMLTCGLEGFFQVFWNNDINQTIICDIKFLDFMDLILPHKIFHPPLYFNLIDFRGNLYAWMSLQDYNFINILSVECLLINEMHF